MRDILTDCLPILDLLEITQSTSTVAALANCDQSSVSRIYRHASRSLGLRFRKCNGSYRARSNRELLASLRQATQLLRLQRGPDHLQWVAASWNSLTVAQMGESQPLPRGWDGDQRALELLEARVLDLAVMEVETGPAGDAWSMVPLAPDPSCGRASRDGALVRRDLLARPAIQALINRLRCGYRQAYGPITALHSA